MYLVESAWKVYTEEITPPYPRYLFVHNSGAKKKTIRLFKCDEESHAEQKFMEAYKEAYYEERYKKNAGLAKLNIYLTFAPCGAQEMNCARALRKFAKDYNFKLNIKAVRAYHENEEDLCQLMTSKYCTVEAFTEQDYRNLAGYLDVTLEENWKHTPDMKKRDGETKQKLKKLQYGEHDYTNIIQCKY